MPLLMDNSTDFVCLDELSHLVCLDDSTYPLRQLDSSCDRSLLSNLRPNDASTWMSRVIQADKMSRLILENSSTYPVTFHFGRIRKKSFYFVYLHSYVFFFYMN